MKRDSFSSFSSSIRSLEELSMLSSSTRERSPSPPPSSQGDAILVFGYGPIVNDLVRTRRNIKTTNLEPAYLDGYRLSFEFGGVANVVRQRGYRVHGVLMTLSSLRDLKKMQTYDIRREVSQRLVFHYPKNGFVVDEDAVDEEEKEEPTTDMAYVIEYPEDVEHTLLTNDPAVERLPQESYLKLIADGMRQNRVCYEYIEDSILNIPYTPDRSVADFRKFPPADKVAKISFETYQDLCDTARTEGSIYFVLGNSVFLLGVHNPNNPLVKWLEEHGHGKGDITYFVQMVIMSPSMPFCRRRSEVTPKHITWAENQLVETARQHGLDAQKVFEFVQDNESEDGPSKFFTVEEDKQYDLRPTLDDSNCESGYTMESSGRLSSERINQTNKKRFKVPVFLQRIRSRNHR